MVYNPKSTTIKEVEEERNLWIKSKRKYQWSFKISLKELVSALEISIKEDIISNYWVEYTSYWDQIIKIKIKDKNLMVEKLITITLFYSKNDEIYWHIVPLFLSAEKGQKAKKYEVRKFIISETEDICKAIVIKLVKIIEEF